MIRQFTPYRVIYITLCLVVLTGCQSMVRFASRPDAGRPGPSAGGSYGAQAPASSLERRLIAVAESWIGTPYRYAGTTKNGVDCSALMVNVFSEVGIALPRTSSEQYITGNTIATGELAVGDLVFFDINGGGVSHVGMYIGNNTFIHASLSSGVVRESLLLPYYSSRYVGARRVFMR